MTKEQSFVPADHIDLDPFMNSQTRERAHKVAIAEHAIGHGE